MALIRRSLWFGWGMAEAVRANAHGSVWSGSPTRLPDEVIEAMFLLSTAAVGFFLNTVVIACLISVRSRRTISSVFVLHGCLLDAVKCLYSVPFATSLLRRGPPSSCALLGGSFVLLVTASAVNIVATVCSEAYSFRFDEHHFCTSLTANRTPSAVHSVIRFF